MSPFRFSYLILCKYHIFTRLVSPTTGFNEASILKLLYSFLHVENQLDFVSRNNLISSGLLFHKADGNCELVYERKYIVGKLYETRGCCLAAFPHKLLLCRPRKLKRS